MRVTRWGEFGILCSLYLARKGENEAVGAAEIAEKQSIPIQYTQQILQRLRKGGIIKSVRGPKGGYALVRSPIETTLKDILYAAEGETFEVICESDPVYTEKCEGRVCGLRSVWTELRTVVDDFLSKRSLAWLIENESLGFPPSEVLVPLSKAN